MTEKDEWLSANFRLREFCRSQEATRLGMEILPPDDVVENLRRLCTTVLQPLRNDVRSNVRISSGYRPPWLNERVGGSKTSMHPFGCAADLEVEGMKNEDVCFLVQELKLPVDQCILEFPPDGWVHLGIALPGRKVRGQFLTARRMHGAVTYVEGIRP